jgi:hypothetical protein
LGRRKKPFWYGSMAEVNNQLFGCPNISLIVLEGFSLGHTSSPAYNGQFIADSEDVVVVTIKYNPSLFGLPLSGDG